MPGNSLIEFTYASINRYIWLYIDSTVPDHPMTWQDRVPANYDQLEL